jgi:hypothetical protein
LVWPRLQGGDDFALGKSAIRHTSTSSRAAQSA